MVISITEKYIFSSAAPIRNITLNVANNDVVDAGDVITCTAIGHPTPNVTITCSGIPCHDITDFSEVSVMIPEEAKSYRIRIRCRAENVVGGKRQTMETFATLEVRGESFVLDSLNHDFNIFVIRSTS